MKKNIYLLLILGAIFMIPSTVKAVNLTACGASSTYTTLNDAVAASNSGDTITLQGDCDLAATLWIGNGKNLTINLNNNDITRNSAEMIHINGATVNFTGIGTIADTGSNLGSAIRISGSSNPSASNYTNVTIGSGVTVKAFYAVMLTQTVAASNGLGPNGTALAAGSNYIYGITLNMNGTVIGLTNTTWFGSGLYINGVYQNTGVNHPVINVGSSAVVTGAGAGIYAAGYAKWTFANGSSVTGNSSAIALKAGNFTFNGGSYLCTGPDTSPTSGNNNGVEASGAALQIESNTSYAGNIDIAINGGTFKSNNGVVFYEYLGSGTVTKVTNVQINDGIFQSGTLRPVFMVSNSFKTIISGYINGGTYNGIAHENNTGITLVGLNGTDLTDQTLTVNSLTTSSTNTKEQLTNKVNVLAKGNKVLDVFDISLYFNSTGEKREDFTDFSVKVSIPLDDKYSNHENLQIIYIDDEGNVHIIPSQIVNGNIEFVVDHFSEYGIIGTPIGNISNPNTSDINLPFVLGTTLLTIIGVTFTGKKLTKESKI